MSDNIWHIVISVPASHLKTKGELSDVKVKDDNDALEPGEYKKKPP